MDYIFEGDDFRPAPKSVTECTRIGIVEGELWKWYEKIESWGLIAAAINIFFGTFLMCVFFVVYKSLWFGILAFVASLVSAFFTYWLFKVISLFIGAWTCVVGNTKILANVALYQASQQDKKKAE